MSDDPEASGESADEGTAAPAGERGDYKVGYGRPPQHSRIKKGEVRNPRGKRRGKQSFKAEMADVLKMQVPTGKGKGTVSVRKASGLKLAKKALKGDLKAIERLHEYAIQFDEDEGNRATTAALSAEDQQILDAARTRQREVLLADLRAEASAQAAAAVLSAPNREETDQ